MDLLGKQSRRLVASVFYDDDVARIWFKLGDLGIRGKDLTTVGDLIIAGKVACYGNVPASVLKGRTAQYSNDRNRMLLGTHVSVHSQTTVMQSAILHEGVHAYLDYKKASGTTVLHNEAAAYVTQALFLRSKKQAWPALVRNDPLIRAVEALVDRYRMTRNRAWLRWVHFEPLMRAIQTHPAYLLRGGLLMPWSTKTPADGIARLWGPQGTAPASVGAARSRGPRGAGINDPSMERGLRGPVGFA